MRSTIAIRAAQVPRDIARNRVLQRHEACIVAGTAQIFDLGLREILILIADKRRHVDIFDVGGLTERTKHRDDQIAEPQDLGRLLKAAEDADGLIYDPASGKVLVVCGDAGVMIPISPDVDAANGKADPAVELGGKPEFLAAMKLLAERGLQIDVNGGGGPYLEAVARLAMDLPDLRIVIDHVGGAGDPTQLKDEWKNGMYWQDDKPVVDQTEAEGHAVRAMYLYSGMTDVAALTGDTAYLKAIDKIWENMVTKKMYVQGSIGAVGDGERFGDN